MDPAVISANDHDVDEIVVFMPRGLEQKVDTGSEGEHSSILATVLGQS